MTIVVVTGGRHFVDKGTAFTVLNAFHAKAPITMLMHGACGVSAADAHLDPSLEFAPMRGADALAHEWATVRGVRTALFFADWDRLGNAAGPARNTAMLAQAKECGCRGVIAFPGGAGTADCVRQAVSMGLKVARVISDAEGWDVEAVPSPDPASEIRCCSAVTNSPDTPVSAVDPVGSVSPTFASGSGGGVL